MFLWFNILHYSQYHDDVFCKCIHCAFYPIPSDKNECEEWGHCDQHCINTDGSYKCMCTVGFVLQDETRCSAITISDKLKMTLYFTHHDRVLKVSCQPPCPNHSFYVSPFSLPYRVYWCTVLYCVLHYNSAVLYYI